MKAIKFEPGKDPCLIEIENSLKALQKAVGGYIETVTFEEDACLIVNEEGMFLNLKPQKIFGRTFLGNALIVGVKGDEFADVPECMIRLVGTKEYSTEEREKI